MNAKALFFFLVAIACGGAAALFANNWLREQVGEVAQPEQNLTPVIVASSEIEYGQAIEDIHVKVARWPAENAPPKSIGTLEEVIGKLATQRILPGEPILEGRVVEKLAGSSLSSMIAPNKRAITLRVNDVVGVAGFLLPGNRVDVLGTRMSNGEAKTRTVLQNLKVLAVDQTASPEKDQPVVVRAVTLEADLDESLELVKATEEGSIQLVLRNPDDIAERIYAPETVAEAPKAPVRRAPPPTIRIIRGTSVNDSPFAN